MSRSSEGQGHNVTCLGKGHVSEYEVNRLTNEKVIKRKTKL